MYVVWSFINKYSSRPGSWSFSEVRLRCYDSWRDLSLVPSLFMNSYHLREGWKYYTSFSLRTSFIFTILICAHRMRVHFCPQHFPAPFFRGPSVLRLGTSSVRWRCFRECSAGDISVLANCQALSVFNVYNCRGVTGKFPASFICGPVR